MENKKELTREERILKAMALLDQKHLLQTTVEELVSKSTSFSVDSIKLVGFTTLTAASGGVTNSKAVDIEVEIRGDEQITGIVNSALSNIISVMNTKIAGIDTQLTTLIP